MEVNPVVIVGGGLWGGLYAYAMKCLHPQVKIKFYEHKARASERHLWTVSSRDIPQSLKGILEPFITTRWPAYTVRFPGWSRTFKGEVGSISSEHFYHLLREKLGTDFQWKDDLSLEEALTEGCFAIDARGLTEAQGKGFRQYVELALELTSAHGLSEPTLFEAKINENDTDCYLRLIPIDALSLVFRETRYLEGAELNSFALERSILEEVSARGWRVEKVLHKEIALCPLVEREIPPLSFGRVVNVAGIFHDSLEQSLPEALQLIDRLVNASSFRLGEVRNVVNEFRKLRAEDRKFYRLFQKTFFVNAKARLRQELWEHIFRLPTPLVERFQRGELMTLDKVKILAGSPGIPFVKVLQVFDPIQASLNAFLESKRLNLKART